MPLTTRSPLTVLFLCKKDSAYAHRAADFLRNRFSEVLVFEGTRFDTLPPEVLGWKGDLLISFISSWVLPERLLHNARLAAINFHPGSPEYPGTGCTNFAVYNNEKEYGVTAHHMKASVDTGSIIAVSRFPINPDDTVYSITQTCYELIEDLFYTLMETVLEGNPLPEAGIRWGREAYTRKQLNELCEIKLDMSPQEIERRIRATTFEQPWAFVRINGHKFQMQ